MRPGTPQEMLSIIQSHNNILKFKKYFYPPHLKALPVKMYFYRCMSLFITSLNSGSNGNCYYIGNATEAVLIDAGLSCKETEKRMRQLNLPIEKVKAIFISHEHTDHIKGLAGLVSKFALPYYITAGTFKRSGLVIGQSPLWFTAFQPINIGSIAVTAFPKYHDAADAHSFILSHQGVTVGVFTDIGKPCERIIHYFSQCHCAFLEANYDENMLENGRYPIYLKNRIRGGHGHLSNRQALDLFIAHKPAFMTHLLLAHLSKENNHPQLVQDLFNKHAKDTRVIVASRYEPSEVLAIQLTKTDIIPVPIATHKKERRRTLHTNQLSLFD